MRWADSYAGTGNWLRFPRGAMDEVYRAAEDWACELAGVTKPWLCWCVDDEWCIVQQKLVRACGWTPIVGRDRPGIQPSLIPGAVFVDFNRMLKFEIMYGCFPLEFVYLFADLLAFWHSDVLPPVAVMRAIGSEFESISPGEFIGVRDNPTLLRRLKRVVRGLRKGSLYWFLHNNTKRWFEVIGCTTAEATRSQFDHGCGLWRHIELHPNAKAEIKALNPHWEHGTGIWYWEQIYDARVRKLSVNIHSFHYVAKGKHRVYDRDGLRKKKTELRNTHDLESLVGQLGLTPE